MPAWHQRNPARHGKLRSVIALCPLRPGVIGAYRELNLTCTGSGDTEWGGAKQSAPRAATPGTIRAHREPSFHAHLTAVVRGVRLPTQPSLCCN